MKEVLKSLGLFAAKATYVFALVAVSILILAGAFFSTVMKIDENIDSGYENTYSANGEAKLKVKLDTADVTLGVVLKDSTALAAQKAAGERYQKVVESIKTLGIPEEDIQTQGYNVNTVYKYETNTVEGYEVNLSVVVTVRNSSTESELLSQVINAGAENGFNSVNNLSFYLEDMTTIEDQLKAEAIEDAKKRAQNEASVAGLQLGEVINMYSNNYGPYYDYRNTMPMMEANYAQDMGAGTLDSFQIQAGQTEVIVNVTLEYEIL